MASWRWQFRLLLTLAVIHVTVSRPDQCPSSGNICYQDDVAKLQPSSTSYFAVGGLFDVHKRGPDAFACGAELNPVGLLHSQAFLWSLDYWSNQVSVSIGAVVLDNCERKDQMIQNVLGFGQCNVRVRDIESHNTVGFVGPTSNVDAVAAAKLTADLQLTLISPSADSGLLSDAEKYPFFLRTTPTIQVDIDIMVDVLTNVQTEYVAAIYQEMEESTFELFRTKAQDNFCITGSYRLTGEENPSSLRSFVGSTLASLEDTRFVALFLSPQFAETFMAEVTAQDEIKSMNFVFLMTSDIRRSSSLFNGQNAVAAGDAIVLERAEPSSVTGAVSAFKNYWNDATISNSLTQNSRLANPFLTQYLADGNRLPAFDVEAASTIMATKAFVDGTIRALRAAGCSSNNVCSQFLDSPDRGSSIYNNIRTATGFFSAPDSGGQFEDGDLSGSALQYNIYRYKSDGTFVKIGDYTNGASTINGIQGTGPYQPGQCQDSPCLQCGEQPATTPAPARTTVTVVAECVEEEENGNYSVVYYPPDQEITGAYMQSVRLDSEWATRFEIGQRWIIALGVLAGLGILSVIIFEIYILYKLLGTRMGQKWRTMWLGQLLLFGVFLCYLTLFAYIMIPTKATCGVTRFGVGVSYSVCFAVLLVKLMVILTSKSSESSLLPGDGDSPNYLKGIYQFLMFVFVVGVQVVIDAQWLITVPPEAVKVMSNNDEMVWVCNHYTFRATGSMNAMSDMSNFVRNEFENHVLSLVYIMFLILITTILALRAHGIITNHRESVFIGVASGFSIPVWLAWTLVGGLNKDDPYAHEFGDACIAFGLFVTATLILFAMFLPKVRQLVNMGVEGIYFEDDRETVYGGSVIMAPSYKSRPGSVVYVNNQGIYSDPVVVGNGDGSTYMRQPGSDKPTPVSTYSAPPTYLKRGGDSTIRGGGSVLRVTDDLSGRRPADKRRPLSEVAYGTAGRPRSVRGTLPRVRSHSELGAL